MTDSPRRVATLQRTHGYQLCTSRPYGATVKIPAPVGIALETEPLKDYTP
ncbi:hypothetical protein [Streptomyces scopuliridis]